MKYIVFALIGGIIAGAIFFLTIQSAQATFGNCHQQYVCKRKHHNICVDWDKEWVCTNPSPTPTIEPSPEPTPESTPSATPNISASIHIPGPTHYEEAKAPVNCPNGDIIKEPANVHVYRKEGDAIVKWIPQQGTKAHVYYRQNTTPNWEYSFTTDNTGYVEIHDLGSMDITFAVQEEDSNHCVSPISKAIVDGPEQSWTLFR